MKSPLSITYDDLIEATEKRLIWMEQSYPSKLLTREISDFAATRNIAVQRKLLKLLKKCKREKQMDLFFAFQNMK